MNYRRKLQNLHPQRTLREQIRITNFQQRVILLHDLLSGCDSVGDGLGPWKLGGEGVLLAWRQAGMLPHILQGREIPL